MDDDGDDGDDGDEDDKDDKDDHYAKRRRQTWLHSGARAVALAQV